MNRDEIIDELGAENWEMVAREFEFKTRLKTKRVLDEMFPTEENGELAKAIFEELSKP